jgi:hypothetical protein
VVGSGASFQLAASQRMKTQVSLKLGLRDDILQTEFNSFTTGKIFACCDMLERSHRTDH